MLPAFETEPLQQPRTKDPISVLTFPSDILVTSPRSTSTSDIASVRRICATIANLRREAVVPYLTDALHRAKLIDPIKLNQDGPFLILLSAARQAAGHRTHLLPLKRGGANQKERRA